MKTSRLVGTMLAVSVTAVALTGATVAFADQDAVETTSQQSRAESRQGPGHGGYGPGRHGPAKFGQMLHGESVVKLKDGTYSTQRTQVGEVTSTSATSLTVRSEDGFTATYVVGDKTILVRDRVTGTAASVGDIAHVRATVTDTTITAGFVMALSPAAVALRDERHQGDEKRQGRSPSRA